MFTLAFFLHILPFLPPVTSWSLDTGSLTSILECHKWSFTISGGDANTTSHYYELLFLPLNNTERILSYPFPSTLNLTMSVPFPSSPIDHQSLYIPMARENVTGVVSVAHAVWVDAGVNGIHNLCLPPSKPSNDFAIQITTDLLVNTSTTISWNSADVQGNVTFLGIVPANGPSPGSNITIIPDGLSSQATESTTSFSWTPPDDTEFVLIASDNRGFGSGGHVKLKPRYASYLCAFPMSAQYSVLQRGLFYFLFFVGLVPAVTGFIGPLLGAAMIFSSGLTMHAYVLQARKSANFIDIDSLPLFQVLSISLYASCLGLVCIPFQDLCPKHGIFALLWTVISLSGMYCAASASTIAPKYPCAPVYGTDGSVVQVTNVTVCSEFCSSVVSSIRDSGTVTTIDLTSFPDFNDLVLVCQILGAIGSSGPIFYGIMKLMAIGSSEKEKDKMHTMAWKTLNFLLIVAVPLSLGGILAQSIKGEMEFKKSKIEYDGTLKSADQWGPWVALAITLVGTFMNSVFDRVSWGNEAIDEGKVVTTNGKTDAVNESKVVNVQLESLGLPQSRVHPSSALPLRLTARRINEWIRAVQFESLHFKIGNSKSISLCGHLVKSPGSALLPYVRRVLVGSNLWGDEVTLAPIVALLIERMPNLRHLSFWTGLVDPKEQEDFAFILLSTPLERLSLNPHPEWWNFAFYVRENDGDNSEEFPLRKSLTHLQVDETVFTLEDVQSFGSLTHLASTITLDNDELIDRLQRFQTFLAQKENVHMLVLVPDFPVGNDACTRANESFGRVGNSGLRDFWERAERILEERAIQTRPTTGVV
ncbi:hypothetical protein DL96DRAFT_1678182 [Flagelloscypha sp. PMI_526]|nr:hypothetical protein DL96DRAFT_1678182 [Flagelloscypha sp. PMI_526]